MYYHQQRCVYKISNQNQTFSLLAAIHLFARSVTKSKISTSPAKKLVAATFCVQKIIHHQNFIANWHANTLIICGDILMRCAVNSIFDCAGVWAGGHTVPSRYGRRLVFLQLINTVICEDILMRNG